MSSQITSSSPAILSSMPHDSHANLSSSSSTAVHSTTSLHERRLARSQDDRGPRTLRISIPQSHVPTSHPFFTQVLRSSSDPFSSHDKQKQTVQLHKGSRLPTCDEKPSLRHQSTSNLKEQNLAEISSLVEQAFIKNTPWIFPQIHIQKNSLKKTD
jgi:hypothetical protein